MWIQWSLKLNTLCSREDNQCFRMIWLLQPVKYQAILSINWNSTVCSWSQLTVALCTEYLWTCRFSDLLFDLYYWMILIINVPTQFLMSSIVLKPLNFFDWFHLFFWLPSHCVHQHTLNKETGASLNSGKVLPCEPKQKLLSVLISIRKSLHKQEVLSKEEKGKSYSPVLRHIGKEWKVHRCKKWPRFKTIGSRSELM